MFVRYLMILAPSNVKLFVTPWVITPAVTQYAHTSFESSFLSHISREGLVLSLELCGFFGGAIKVGKALSTIFIFILPIREHFRNRLGKAAFSSTVNDPSINGSIDFI